MNNQTTNIVFLLDETGSMESCKSDTIGGFNAFLNDQKKSENNIRFSLTLFNSSKIEKRYFNESLDIVEPLSESNYRPSNLTPLWDAIGNTINEMPDHENLLFVILTDGYENASKEFTNTAVRKMIAEKKKRGWEFLFLGADLDNFNDAENLGIDRNFSVAKDEMMSTYQSLSDTVKEYAACKTVNFENKRK